MHRADSVDARTLNGANPPDDEDSGSDQDSSSSVSSMSSDEIESHFVERRNRRFHSHGNGHLSSYPFPVDDLEGQRLDRTHELAKETLGGHNHRGPIQQTLALPAGGRRVRILDIGTGNGRWVEEMAEEFPHAKVYGLDIVPLATRYPADNVQFEVHDINSTTRWMQGRFDMVHMRQAFLSPINYPTIIREVARILRPSGLFLACEWIPGIFATDGADVPQPSGLGAEFFDRLNELATRRRLFFDPLQISRMLRHNAFYEDVVIEHHAVPLDGSARGQRAKAYLIDLGDALHCSFLDCGLSSSQIEHILLALRNGLDNIHGVCIVYLTTYAKRRAIV